MIKAFTCSKCKQEFDQNLGGEKAGAQLQVDGQGSGNKSDQDKERTDLLSIAALESVAKVLTHGAKKYGARNWEKGIAWSRCYGAALRHLFAWWRKEDQDPETHLSHLAHATTNLMFLLEYLKTHPELDDRP